MPFDPRRRAARVTLPEVLVCLCFLVLPAMVVRPISDPSPWLHLRVGRFLLSGQHFGLPDPFAPYATNVYVPTQWLPSVVTAALYPSFGPALVAWERTAAITALALCLLVWARSISRLWVATAATALAVFAAWPSLTERPQVAGFVLLVPVCAAWWRTASDHQPRWYLIPLTWLAAATHGIWATGVVVGALVAGTLWVTRRLDRREATRLGAVLAGSLLAAACTPVGPRLLLTPFSVGSQGRQFVQEWLPSSVRSPHVLAALGLLAAAWLCWVLTQHRPQAWEVVLLLTGAGLALTAQRTVAVAAIVAVPLACSAVERVLQSREAPFTPRPAARSWRWWAAAALAGLAVSVPVAASRAAEPAIVPSALVPQLSSLAPGTHIVVNGDTSGWLLFAEPDLKPVFDVRVESYSSRQVSDFIDALAAKPGWDRYLIRRGVTAALVRTDSPLRAALTEQWHWTERGTDAGVVLLVAP
jgi:hypothetical protein